MISQLTGLKVQAAAGLHRALGATAQGSKHCRVWNIWAHGSL